MHATVDATWAENRVCNSCLTLCQLLFFSALFHTHKHTQIQYAFHKSAPLATIFPRQFHFSLFFFFVNATFMFFFSCYVSKRNKKSNLLSLRKKSISAFTFMFRRSPKTSENDFILLPLHRPPPLSSQNVVSVNEYLYPSWVVQAKQKEKPKSNWLSVCVSLFLWFSSKKKIPSFFPPVKITPSKLVFIIRCYANFRTLTKKKQNDDGDDYRKLLKKRNWYLANFPWKASRKPCSKHVATSSPATSSLSSDGSRRLNDCVATPTPKQLIP